MINRELLELLPTDTDKIGVSIYMPTQTKGADIQQNPLVLKNLLDEAAAGLDEAQVSRKEAQAYLEPALKLLSDPMFWRHTQPGLVLLLDGQHMHTFHSDHAFDQRVVVGAGFHLRPLLAAWSQDGTYHILTLSADQVRLYQATRITHLEMTEQVDLPSGVEEFAEENPETLAQSAPTARPHTPGQSVSVSHAQAYGNSPEDWRKARLQQFAQRVAKGVDAAMQHREGPLVVIADEQLAGQFAKHSTLGARLAEPIFTNPASMSPEQMQSAAYEKAFPHLDAARVQAWQRYQQTYGQAADKVAVGPAEAVAAAYNGQVEAVFFDDREPVWGVYDQQTNQLTELDEPTEPARDMVQSAVIETLRNGGQAYVVDGEDLSKDAVVATLRY